MWGRWQQADKFVSARKTRWRAKHEKRLCDFIEALSVGSVRVISESFSHVREAKVKEKLPPVKFIKEINIKASDTMRTSSHAINGVLWCWLGSVLMALADELELLIKAAASFAEIERSCECAREIAKSDLENGPSRQLLEGNNRPATRQGVSID